MTADEPQFDSIVRRWLLDVGVLGGLVGAYLTVYAAVVYWRHRPPSQRAGQPRVRP